MTTASAGWRHRDGYRYVASLDGPLLAWEYLRRNTQYRAAWRERDPVLADVPGHVWGLLLPDRPRARGAQRESDLATRPSVHRAAHSYAHPGRLHQALSGEFD
jgi:hypothetical protein